MASQQWNSVLTKLQQCCAAGK